MHACMILSWHPSVSNVLQGLLVLHLSVYMCDAVAGMFNQLHGTMCVHDAAVALQSFRSAAKQHQKLLVLHLIVYTYDATAGTFRQLPDMPADLVEQIQQATSALQGIASGEVLPLGSKQGKISVRPDCSE